MKLVLLGAFMHYCAYLIRLGAWNTDHDDSTGIGMHAHKIRLFFARTRDGIVLHLTHF